MWNVLCAVPLGFSKSWRWNRNDATFDFYRLTHFIVMLRLYHQQMLQSDKKFYLIIYFKQESLDELSVARIIWHEHPHRYPYGHPSKWLKGTDIRTDAHTLWTVTWISIRIPTRMSVSYYPLSVLQSNWPGIRPQTKKISSFRAVSQNFNPTK